MKDVKKLLEEAKLKRIEAHMPAKDAEELTEDEITSVERFQWALDAAIMAGRDTTRNVETDGFHASSLGIAYGRCQRRNVYLLRGVAKKPNFDARVLRIFDNGHDVHARLQKVMEKMDIDMQSEIRIESDEFGPPIRSSADGGIVWEDEPILIEIKSCSPTVYENRATWKKPKDDHYDQANLYAHVLGYDKIWIIYENKGTQEIMIFEKKANRKKSQKIIDDWYAQWLCFEEGELPERPYKPGSPTCKACDLYEHCMADPEKGVEIKPYKAKVKKLRDEELHIDSGSVPAEGTSV